MLQLSQIKNLLAAHIQITHDSERSTVFDHYGTLTRSHPNDETGEDWQSVEPDFNPAEYKIYQHDTFGTFHNMKESIQDEKDEIRATKLVKFSCPKPLPEGYRPRDAYVVIEFVDPNAATDELATEMAIDYLVLLGWTEEQAQPLLVI